MEEECRDWFQQKLPNHMDLFVQNDFKTLASVAIVDKNDLLEMGITSIGQRKEILAQIANLKQPFGIISAKSSLLVKTLQTCKLY